MFKNSLFILHNNNFILSYGTSLIEPYILAYFMFFFIYLINFIFFYFRFYLSAFYVIYILLFPVLTLFLFCFDLFLLVFMLETLSISLYFLIILSSNNNSKSIETVFKYFFIGAISTFLLLMSISLIYGHIGTTSFIYIKYFFLTNFLSLVKLPFLLSSAIIFILIAFFLKLGVFPFNWWVPDVYEGMNYNMLLFYNTIIKVSIFLVFIKTVIYLFIYLVEVQYIIYLGSVGSLIYGCFGSINQLNIKRFMAFTGINNMGWLLMGLSCGTIEGLASTFIYLFIYTIMNTIFFIILLRISVLDRPFYYFSDMNYLSKFDPLSAILLLIVLCSMGGFPPFGGFFAKYCLVFAAINSGLYSLVFFSLLVSAISGYYYLKLIKSIFFDSSNRFKSFNLIKKIEINLFLEIILLILIYILLSFGFIVSEVYNIFLIYSLDYFAPLF